jgi:hypothetical protein
MTYHDAARHHVTTFFAGHQCTEQQWDRGPMADVADFSVVRFSPGPKTKLWSYCSLGASSPRSEEEERFEFLLLSPRSDDRIVELVTMVAHYHRTERLGLRHMFAIGEPWLDQSRCDCMATSLPYPFGPQLERLDSSGLRARFLWVVPITSSERAFARDRGLEELEQRFDSVGLRYWEVDRAPVV